MILHNVNISSMKKKNPLILISCHSLNDLYLCKYVLYVSQRHYHRSGQKRAPKRGKFTVILFLTLVVHNSVVYAVLYVTKNVWYYLHFFVPLTDMKKKILKEIQKCYEYCKLNTDV